MSCAGWLSDTGYDTGLRINFISTVKATLMQARKNWTGRLGSSGGVGNKTQLEKYP